MALIYRVWMKAAHFIGAAVTVKNFNCDLFFNIYTSQFIFKAQKDYLQHRLDLSAKIYWQLRQLQAFSKVRYHQQG